MQSVNPVALAKVPDVHKEQLAELMALANVPTGQAMQEVDSVADWW